MKNDTALNATRMDGRHSKQGEGRGLKRLHGAFSLFLASFNLEAQKKRPRWIHLIRRSLLIITLPMGVSEFLCKRDGLQLTQIRSPNSMVNRFSAAFQSRIGMLHFWLMLRKAR